MTPQEHNAFPNGRWSSTHHAEPEWPQTPLSISPHLNAPTNGGAENKSTQCALAVPTDGPERELAAAPGAAHDAPVFSRENCAPVETAPGASLTSVPARGEISQRFKDEPTATLIAGLQRANDSLAREVTRLTAELKHWRAEEPRDDWAAYRAYHYAHARRHAQSIASSGPLTETHETLLNLIDFCYGLANIVRDEIKEKAD